MNIEYTLDQLTALEAIDRLGSFSGAAKELGRATSAVSYAVKTLEHALDLELFDRSGHRAELTPAGRVVLQEARYVIRRAQGLQHRAAQLRQEWEPEVVIVLDGIVPMTPLIQAMRRFSGLGLPTRIQIRVEYLSGVRQRFHDDNADLMLAVDATQERGLVTHPLPPIRMFLLVHRDHPLRKLGRAVTREDLAQHVELIVNDSGPVCWESPLLALGSPHVFELSDFYSKREALVGGIGFGWVPEHLVTEPLSSGALELVGFEEGDEHVFYPRVAHRRDVPLGRAAETFMVYLQDQLQDGSA